MASHLSLCTLPSIKFPSPPFPRGRTLEIASPNNRRKTLKVSADRRDNLDHLQRSFPNTKRSPPKGLRDIFPTVRTVQEMMDTMEKMMEEDGHSSTVSSSTRRDDEYSGGRKPWAIIEGPEHYKIRFDMPGMTKEDVRLWVEEKMLVLKAQKAPTKTQGQQKVEDVDEWPAKSFGRYSCRITLPANIEFEKIKAEVKDGVLYITIPKATPMTKVIDINVH